LKTIKTQIVIIAISLFPSAEMAGAAPQAPQCDIGKKWVHNREYSEEYKQSKDHYIRIKNIEYFFVLENPEYGQSTTIQASNPATKMWCKGDLRKALLK